MAKPVIKFNAVAYQVNGHTGYRPALEPQDPVADLDYLSFFLRKEGVTVGGYGILLP